MPAQTTTVKKARDLQVGDVVTRLGATVLPFPFVLSKVLVLDRYNAVTVRADHGYVSGRPMTLDTECEVSA